MHNKYFAAFLKTLLLYGLLILVLARSGDEVFENLHLVFDSSSGMLALLLALFLMSAQHGINPQVRQYLIIGFSLAAGTEILHALVGIEWMGSLAWIQDYALILRPATWPPSTYVLPLALAWLLWLERRQSVLSPRRFAAGMVTLTLILLALSWHLPRYVDTGILGIQRPTQLPLLALWLVVIAECWRCRAQYPLYEGIAWMGALLFLSDLCMLYSTSPHDKLAMMAHTGKVLAYLLLHVIQMRISITENTARSLIESQLRIAATAFESREGMLIASADHVIQRINQAYTRLTGYQAQDLIGQHTRILQSGNHDASFYSAMWDSVTQTGNWEGELWNRRKNGDLYPAYLTLTAVQDTQGYITHYIATLNDITERKSNEEKIQQLAFFDPLTQLPNRRLLRDRLTHAIATSARSGKNGAVLFLDLDHFKTINDTMGHEMGDRLLQQVALRLSACVRDGDTVARLGGDEFVVLLEDLSPQPLQAAAQAKNIGQKIHNALIQPYLLGARGYNNTPSMGIALFQGLHATLDELLQQADIAMYQAKSAGRNGLCFFDPNMQTSITQRSELENELREALKHRQFQLHYQIQVDQHHRPLGAEALIRWVHPTRGMVSPAQFIPLAEETGLILPIGHWVLDTACAQLQAWQKEVHTQHLILSINVSAKQFRQPGFFAQVQASVQHYGINTSRLKLELTESLLLDNIEDIISTMSAINAIGIRFSLDDFGTGYSSLQYLKRLPLDQLKIDQSFVRDITTDKHDKAIVRTIIAMAESLSLNVIAEGVETEEQRQLLLQKGCLNFQGYLFSKPVPIAQLEALLQPA